MISRASRLFFGLSAVSFFMAVLYGVVTEASSATTVGDTLGGDGAVNAVLGPLTLGYKGGVGDHIGYALLMGFALATAVMGAFSSAFRDGDAEALAEHMALDAAPAVNAPSDPNLWPAVAAVGAAVTTIGLASSPVLFVAGVVMLAISVIEWAVKDWSERATGDPEVNRAIRNRMAYPVELPASGVILLGIMAFSLSRLFLAVSKNGAIIVALVAAALIFAGAVLLSNLDRAQRRVALGLVLSVGLIAVVGAGVFGAARGERDFEVHHNDEHGSAVPTGETE
jgi:hypothetical protein